MTQCERMTDMEDLRHLWASVTTTLCGLDAFQLTGAHVEMTKPMLVKVTAKPAEATCPTCLEAAKSHPHYR